jgi:hypothetical protein
VRQTVQAMGMHLLRSMAGRQALKHRPCIPYIQLPERCSTVAQQHTSLILCAPEGSSPGTTHPVCSWPPCWHSRLGSAREWRWHSWRWQEEGRKACPWGEALRLWAVVVRLWRGR